MNIRPFIHSILAAALLLPAAPASAAPPDNDDFGDAVTINPGSLPTTTATIDVTDATEAGSDPLFPVQCSNPPSQKHRTVWYRLTPASSGWLLVSTFGSGYDTVLGVWTGSEGSLNLVGCNDDSGGVQSAVGVPVTQGTPYYIEVASFAEVLDPVTENGDLNINVGALPYVVYVPLVLGD